MLSKTEAGRRHEEGENAPALCLGDFAQPLKIAVNHFK